MAEDKQPSGLSSQEMLKLDRYLWIARAFSAVAILAFVANVLLFVAISSLYPLTRVQPFYLNILDKNQQVIDIKPIRAEELQSASVLESLVRQYVLARYQATSNINEVEERWGIEGIVALMSSPSVYDEFVNRFSEKVLSDIRKSNLTIDAKIESAAPFPENILVWTVKVTLEITGQNMADKEIRKFEDQLEVQFDPLFEKAYRVSWQDRLKNPLGFRVVTYGSKPIRE